MWNLYEKEKFLEPLRFSNGKTQGDVVKEVLEAIDEGHKVIFIHGICGTGKCLDKDALVFCKPEEKKCFSYWKISELAGKRGSIISLDDKGEIVESNFKNVRNTGSKKLFFLKTRTGREILASENHPFLTITNKGVEWKRLDELDENSYICLPNKIKLRKSSELKDEEVKVLAHLISEGKLGDKAGSPKYYQDKDINTEIRRDYEEALKTLFPEGEIHNSQQTQVTIVFRNMDTRFGTTNKLRLFVRKFGLDGKKSKDKFVPNIIFSLGEQKIALFLRTLFSGDGCIYCRNFKDKNEQFIVEYSSISKRLVQDVSLLLNIIGVQHSISPKKFRENKDYCYRISISGQNQVKRFIEAIGFVGEKQKIALEILPRLKEHKFTNIDKIPRVIREYLKKKGYSYNELDRFLSYEEINELKKHVSFKNIKLNRLVKTPCLFHQQKIDFLREHITKINSYIKDDVLNFICSKDIIWDKVKIIEKRKEGETYDLEVGNYHNFIANGIIVHNSAIALNIARKKGKTSIVVPGKSLQSQYKRDYENNKYLKKDNGEKVKISVITGRNNHKCKFLEDNKDAVPKITREVNSVLGIFDGVIKRNEEKEIERDLSADNKDLPCKIEIKERNWNKIKEYLKKNKNVKADEFTDIKDVKRMSIAPICPYWSPVVSTNYELKAFQKKGSYLGLENNQFVIYQRKEGCAFYEQFNSFIDSDVIVFNSLKYKLESALNRKPMTEVEIIDECDEFLDSFSNQKELNIDRLQNSLIYLSGFNEISEKLVNDVSRLIKDIKISKAIEEFAKAKEIIPLQNTEIYEILRIFLASEEIEENVDEESYLFEVEEIARTFEDFLDESYVMFSKRDNNLIASIVTINLAKRLKEMMDKNKVIVMMSGTIHSANVLKNIFGLDSFKVIEAETAPQGMIEVKRTGMEFDCKYSNFSSGRYTREHYLQALNTCVRLAKKPTLVHVNSYGDLPSEEEKERFKLNNLMSRETIREVQKRDKHGEEIRRFKERQIDVLFSTKCTRGIDFPGEQCNSIIFTKYPNPNVDDAFWKILKKSRPEFYWDFYNDKATRELWQRIYRGLRSKDDHIFLLSPDVRVLGVFEKKN